MMQMTNMRWTRKTKWIKTWWYTDEKKGQALEKTRITKQIIKRKKETGENE